MSNDDRLIGASTAAEMLKVDRSTLLRWVRAGKVVAARKMPGRTGDYLFAYAVIARLANERRAA